MADAGAEKEKPAQPKKKAKAKNEAAGEGPSKKAKAAEAKAAKQQGKLANSWASRPCAAQVVLCGSVIHEHFDAVAEAEEEAVAAVSLKGLLAKECESLYTDSVQTTCLLRAA